MLLNAAFLAASWADDPAKTSPPSQQTPTKSSGDKMECDMKGKDMSKMSAEEHKKTMEKCKAQHQDHAEHGNHSHEGKEHT